MQDWFEMLFELISIGFATIALLILIIGIALGMAIGITGFAYFS